MPRFGELLIATYCKNCGFTKAAPAANGADRCTECGRFCADEPDVCCAKHEVRNSPYPSGVCPACEEERRVNALEQEMHQRRADPQMHNMVDAKRF